MIQVNRNPNRFGNRVRVVALSTGFRVEDSDRNPNRFVDRV